MKTCPASSKNIKMKDLYLKNQVCKRTLSPSNINFIRALDAIYSSKPSIHVQNTPKQSVEEYINHNKKFFSHVKSNSGTLNKSKSQSKTLKRIHRPQPDYEIKLKPYFNQRQKLLSKFPAKKSQKVKHLKMSSQATFRNNKQLYYSPKNTKEPKKHFNLSEIQQFNLLNLPKQQQSLTIEQIIQRNKKIKKSIFLSASNLCKGNYRNINKPIKIVDEYLKLIIKNVPIQKRKQLRKI